MRHLASRILFALLLSGVLSTPVQGADEEVAKTEIEHLLRFVGSSNCQFIRNGEEHAPADAESHLRLKYRNGRRYATTAANFIDRLASESSWTGRKYEVRCGEQAPRPSRDWLHAELARYRASMS
jgi:hypothetical protein